MSTTSQQPIPYGRQCIDEDDIAAVVAVLRSDFLTQGPVVPAFEASVANYCGASHGVAVNSATSALHLACKALGLGPGDIAWTSAITFAASANCALYCGAQVDFVDIDPRTYNMSLDALANKLEVAKRSGVLPKVLIPVHLTGQPCDMQRIGELAKHYGFKVIEDASHAIGASYHGSKVGGCQHSDITVFSFHPVKIITSAEGGMAMTNNSELADTMRLLRSHGISSNCADMQPRPSNEIWNYQQIALGFNYRLTDLQAALGLSQMNKLDAFVGNREHVSQHYDKALKGTDWVLPAQLTNTQSSRHLYVVRTSGKLAQQHAFDHLKQNGILANLHYIPVYRHPYFERAGFAAGYCPNAEAYFTSAISIPVHAGLTDKQRDHVVCCLKELASP